MQQVFAQANETYMRFVKIARIACKTDVRAHETLSLLGERKQSFSGWLSQVKPFYTNLLADDELLTKLAKFGVTQEKLEAGQALLTQTETAYATQKKEKGEAQQATQDRDAALDDLEDWYSDFVAIARIALEEKPQLRSD